jgi:hypothetical protein
MQATTQYFVKRFFYKQVLDFFALPKFYSRHLGVKITHPYSTPPHTHRRRKMHCEGSKDRCIDK